MTEAKFTLDTSGVVRGRNDGNLMRAAGKIMPDSPVRWIDLDPFTQGYVEALLRAFQDHLANEGRLIPERREDLLAFSDLAPETLAAILKDCAAFEQAAREKGPWKSTREGGGVFWWLRNAPVAQFDHVGFPPLTPYLGDDGKVYLRDAAAKATGSS